MVEAGKDIAVPRGGRGCAFGDFDNDGDVDIILIVVNEPPALLRNDVTGANNWLKVQLIGTKSSRSAIGTRVVAHYSGRRQAQERMAQASFLCANDPCLHFGLGDTAKVDLEIWWLGEKKETFPNVPASHLVTIREEDGIVRTEKLAGLPPRQ